MVLALPFRRIVATLAAVARRAPAAEPIPSTPVDAPLDDLGDRVSNAREAIAEFGRCSSDEFTALAEALGELDGRFADITRQAGELDRILQEHDEDRALTSAFTLYKKSVDLAHASIGIALSQEEQMELMEEGLLQNRNHFAKNSLMFRVLVMNIRAEAARIPSEERAVFVAVAGEMSAMEQQMNASVEKAFSQLETIVQEAVRDRGQLNSLQTTLHETAQRSIGLLRHELDVIKRGLAPCVEASQEISRLIQAARAQTSTLITSLQYQDIVTQQLVHVSQGFDDLTTPGGSPDAPGRHDLAFIHRAAKVQQSQLKSSRSAVQEAADRIGETSRQLLETGASLVAHFQRMEQVADAVFRGSQVGAMFKMETDRLVGIAGQSETTNARIAALLDRIEQSVRVFSTEIRHYELETQLVALNAQIAASRMPEARALNKLAEETSQLSSNAASLTRLMREQLAETLSHLTGMRQEAGEVRRTIGAEKADLAGGSAEVSAKLARLNDRIHRSSGEASRQFEAAYRRLRDLLQTLQFPALIEPSFAPSEELCTGLLELSAGHATAELTAEAARRIAVQESRYTMQQERESHSAALGATTVAVAASPAAAGIELFGDEPAAAPAAAPAANVEVFGADPAPAPTAPVAATRTVSSALVPPEAGTPPEPRELATAGSAASSEVLAPGVELF